MYHYTSAEGLLSMLRTGHVWATDAFYMNDPGELSYGLEVVNQVAAMEARRQSSALLKRVAAAVKQVASGEQSDGRVFLMSFCGDGDLLSQWRAYGESGGGYALGFDSSAFRGTGPLERPPFRTLRKVVYDAKKQTAIVRRWLTRALARTNPDLWDFELLGLFARQLVTFKNPSYAEEGEWRLVQWGRQIIEGPTPLTPTTRELPISFRSRRGRLIPYVDLDLTGTEERRGPLPIKEIVFGPTLDPQRTEKTLRLLCEASGYGDAPLTVRGSRIPFVG